MKHIKVINNGNNSNIIYTSKGNYCQSYDTNIVFINLKGIIYLDKDKHDYSKTTIKHRNGFLGITSKEVKEGIKNKTIKLTDLNH